MRRWYNIYDYKKQVKGSWMSEVTIVVDSLEVGRLQTKIIMLLLLLFSHLSDSLWPCGLQHARLPCPLLSTKVCSNSCPLSWWGHPTILSSVAPLSSCLQSFPASRFFPVSQLFASGGQSVRALASASVLPMSIQGWFPLGLSGLIPLLSKGLSRVFSSTIIQKH